MAVIKNIIQTQFTSTGAAGVTKDVETLNRSQTRLGQASASAGRAFSAQAKGLGGLVGAYAGAAATVFALQQAFAALAKAAQAETIVQGTKTLALEIGQSGPQILKSIQAITQGQLTLAEAAQNANIALSAGFNTRQIEGFTTVAMKASKALGRDFTDSLQRVVRGVSKLEPELLDELGIFTRLDPAVRAYAKELGVSAASLSEFQRRQAFANAAIEEGLRKFGAIDTTSASAQKSLERLQVQISELSTAFLQIVATTLVPFIDFITNNAGNAVAAFGLLLTLVFKKAGQELGGWAANSIKNLSRYADSVAKTAAQSKASFADISKAAAELEKDISQRGSLSADGGRFAQAKVEKDLATEAARARQRFRDIEKSPLSPSQIEADIKTLKKVQEQVNINSSAYRDANKIVLAYSTALQGAGLQVKALTLSSKALNIAATGLSLAFRGLTLVVNTLFTGIAIAQLVGTIFDIDVIAEIKNKIVELTQASKDLKNGFTGAVLAASGGSQDLVKRLEDIGASSSYIENVSDTIVDLRKRVEQETIRLQATLVASAQANEGFVSNFFKAFTRSTSGMGGLQEIAAINAEAEKRLIQADRIAAIDKLIQQQKEKLSDANAKERADILANIEVYKVLKQELIEFGGFYSELIGQLSRSTGLGAEQIGQIFKDAPLDSLINRAENSLTIFGQTIDLVDGKFSLENATKETKNLVDAGIVASRTIQDLRDGLQAGGISATALGSKIDGLNTQLAVAKEVLNAQADAAVRSSQINEELRTSIIDLESSIAVYTKLLEEVSQIETVIKGLDQAFGSDIGRAATLQYTGLVNLNGELAATQEQQIANQNEFLMALAASTQKSAELAGNKEKIAAKARELNLNADQTAAFVEKTNREAELFDKTIEAIVGRIIDLTLEFSTLASELTKSTAEIEKQIGAIAFEEGALTLQLELDTTNIRYQLEEQLRNLQVQQLQADITLIQSQRAAGIKTELQAIQDVNAKQIQIIELQVAAENARYNNVKENIRLQEAINLQNYNAEKDAIEARRVAAVEETRSRLESLRNQANQFKGLLTAQNENFQQFNTVLSDVLEQGATAFVRAIKEGISTTITPQNMVEPDFTVLDMAITTADTAFKNFEDAQNRLAERQGNLALKKYVADTTRLAEQAAAEEQFHTVNIRRIETENATRENNHKAELNRIGKETGEEAKKRREALAQFLQDFSQTLSQVFDFVNQLVTGIFEGKIIQARQNEEFITSVLADTSERLSAAQSELNSSLERETSLREELINATNTLLESQTSYLETLGRQNEDIAASSKDYVQNLLSQKRTILELADANRSSIALSKQVSSLEETQTSLQQALADATEARINLENKLAATQEILGAITQAVTAQINMLADSLRNLGNAAAGGGSATGGKPAEVIITNIGDAFAPVASTLKTAVTEAAAAAAGKAAITPGGTKEAANLDAASKALSAASTMLSAAFSGFNIGKAIGVALGSDGVASGIGGAIGSVVGTIFKTQISSFLASTVIGKAVVSGVTSALGGAAASALGTVFTAAIPVFGAVIGALLGNLFATKPRGQATGTLTAEGFETTSMSGKKVDPKALAAIPEQALTGVVTALKRAGISFVDTVNTSINFYKKGISGATLEFADGLKETFKGGTVQAAGKFFIDAFFKGVRVDRNEAGLVTFRSLVVDALTPNRETIQNAADRFAELSDTAEKTVERFEEAIRFATQFNDALTKLRGPATNTAEAINLISAAAQQNAIVTSNYYRDFLADTEKTFGIASTEYEAARAAVQTNALAQLGLTRVTRNGTKELVSLREAQSDVNAGFLLITDIIERARGSISVLTTAGFENVGEIIETSINSQIVDAISATAEALSKTLEVLKNPAKAAVFELEDILANSTNRIENLAGIVEGINSALEQGLQVDPSLLAQALNNVEAAQELVNLEISAYIGSLSEAQLQAIASTTEFEAAIRGLAQTQLEYLELVGAQKAVSSLLSTGRRLSKTIAEITGQFNLFRVSGLLAFSVDIDTLTKNLGQTSVNEFTTSLNKMLISIANGTSVSTNVRNSINLLNKELTQGTITSEQYAYGIEQVISTTENYIETLQELAKEYQSTISQISDAFNQSKDVVIKTIQDLGSEIISLTRNISDKTSEILGIYDDTLASVAESGNELFDLRDTAKDAFETASKAVKEFETSNKLSGKSVATLRGELSSVEAEIASLISADNLDFSGFVLLTELSSKQNALKREINSVVAVESEYQDLLDTRAKALEDLSFVEATLTTLDDNLVDTRRKESEIIKKTQDATTSFISAQQELQDITALLAESNFNLNQIRFDEESAVTRVKNALTTYNQDLDKLTSTLEAIGGESGAALQSSFVKAAAGNAEVIFAGLEEAARNAKIGEATAQAIEAFDQLQDLALQVSGFFEPVDEAFTGLETISVSLTDKFQQFSTDIVKYLETEGLAQFYGPGGVFFQFKETLLDTIKNQGFDVLTAPGGPLQNFNTNLMNISKAIETLSSAGNFLDITIQTAETTFGSFVTAVGTDLEKLTAGYVGLSVVGANLSDTAPDTISLYAEGIGNLNAVLAEGGNLSILLEAADAMNSLYSSVTIVDSLLNEINFEVSAQNAKNNIVTAVDIVDSTIAAVDLSVSASTMIDNISTNVNLLNSTLTAVDLSVSAAAMNTAITTAVDTIDTTLTAVDLTTSTSEMVAAIDSSVATLGTTLSSVDLTEPTSIATTAIETSTASISETLSAVDFTEPANSMINNINTNVNVLNSTLGSVDLTTSTDVMVQAINTTVTTLNSTLEGLSLNTATDTAVGKLSETISAINSTLTNIAFSDAEDVAVDAITNTVEAINSVLERIDLTDVTNTAVGKIEVSISAIQSVLDGIDLVEISSSTVSKFNAVVEAIVSTLSTIDLVGVTNSTVSKLKATVTAMESTLSDIDLVGVTESTVDKFEVAVVAIKSTLEDINLVEVTDSAIGEFISLTNAVESTLTNIDLTSVTDSTVEKLTTAISAIDSTLSSIDFVEVTNSTVDKINTLAETTNSTLSAISFVDATASVVKEINSVNELVNSNLSEVSFVSSLQSAVDEINVVNESVNSTLESVDFVSSLSSAVDEITLVNTNINSTLNSVNYATSLDSAINEITLVNTNINSALINVMYSTSLDSAIGEISAVNEDINSTLTAVTFVSSLDSAIGAINAVTGTLNSTLSEVDFVVSTNSVVDKINAYNTAVNSALSNVALVDATDSAVQEITAVNTSINSILNNVDFVVALDSVVADITAVSVDINSALNNVDFVVTTNAVLEKVTAYNVAVNSALSNITLVDATDTVVDKIEAVQLAINSSLDNIDLVVATDSVVEEIVASSSAINSSLNSVTLVSATNSVVDQVTASSSAINSALNSVTLVSATNSVVNKINTSIATINSSLNNINLTSGTNTAIKEISDYNLEVNAALGNVSLSAETSNVVSEVANLNTINIELDKISYSLKLSSAKSAIAAVNTDINKALSDIQIATNLESAKRTIISINADLNAQLAALNATANLTQAKNNIQAVDTELNNRLSSINIATNLAQATTRINSIDDSINSSLGGVNISDATTVFDTLVKVFTQTATDKVTAFKNAIAAFANITTEITNTQGLAAEIVKLANDTGSVKALTDRFVSLQSTITTLTGTTGITALQTRISAIATDLGTAWSNIRLNTSAIPVTAKVDSVNVTGVSLGSTDSGYLRQLAEYRNKFPALAPSGSALTYQTKTFAEGGYVEGLGTSTSDSIPARLSKGEFIIKASSVNSLGHEFLNMLNESGDLDSAISSLGRRGDAKAAHITPEEMMLLKRLGGSGTRNPRTGLREFYNKDGGALGRLFAAQEADILWNTYGSSILQTADAVSSRSVKNNFGHPEMYEFIADPSNPFSLTKKESVDVNPVSLTENALFDAAEISGLQNSQAAVMLALNEMFVARKATPIVGLKSKYGQDKRYSQWDANVSRYSDRNFIDANFGSGYSGVEGIWKDEQNKKNLGYWPDIGYHPGYRAFGGGGNKHGDIPAVNSGYPARFAQAMTNSVDRLLGDTSSYITGTLMSKDIVEQAISKLNSSNSYKDFVDFYMLGATRGAAPTYASGGLVRGQRDSEISALEPGEFVLRKSAVDQMGLDAAYKLNATGDVGGDTNVEVNITNNGAPVNVAATPQIRRENGKIVLDIILEDIRNNGPIRQQIRSIR